MKPVSIISIVYGTLGIIWGTAVSMIIHVQTSIFSNIPFPEEMASIVDINSLFTVLNDMWRLLFPFIFIIGTIYIISGILYLVKGQQYVALTYIAAILNIAWYLGYAVMIQTELLPLINLDPFIPNKLFSILVSLGTVTDAIFYCGYPVFLIVFMSQQRGIAKK